MYVNVPTVIHIYFHNCEHVYVDIYICIYIVHLYSYILIIFLVVTSLTKHHYNLDSNNLEMSDICPGLKDIDDKV